MLPGALTTGHTIGLGVVALVFIVFALASALLVPRQRPDFPGRAGLSVFVLGSIVLFGAMVGAIYLFGKEKPEEASAAEKAPAEHARATFKVEEKEYSITLPSAAKGSLQPGTYELDVHNGGAVAHDVAVQAQGGGSTEKTSLIQPGGDATLTVRLAKGTYDVYCTVPGHRGLGMLATLTVA